MAYRGFMAFAGIFLGAGFFLWLNTESILPFTNSSSLLAQADQWDYSGSFDFFSQETQQYNIDSGIDTNFEAEPAINNGLYLSPYNLTDSKTQYSLEIVDQRLWADDMEEIRAPNYPNPSLPLLQTDRLTFPAARERNVLPQVIERPGIFNSYNSRDFDFTQQNLRATPWWERSPVSGAEPASESNMRPPQNVGWKFGEDDAPAVRDPSNLNTWGSQDISRQAQGGSDWPSRTDIEKKSEIPNTGFSLTDLFRGVARKGADYWTGERASDAEIVKGEDTNIGNRIFQSVTGGNASNVNIRTLSPRRIEAESGRLNYSVERTSGSVFLRVGGVLNAFFGLEKPKQ